MGRREILITVGVILFIVLFVVLFILSRITPSTTTNRNTKNNTTNSTSTKNTTPLVKKEIISVNNIVTDPLVYDGLDVEVESKVVDWVTKRVFTVGSSGGFLSNSGKRLLVVGRDDFKLPKDTKGTELGLGETVSVHLKGRVRIMNKEELGTLMGVDLEGTDIKLDDGNTDSWREGSVLILQSVERTN